MNEELQKQLASILEAATATASSAKDFVLAEMPDVVKQLLLWELWRAAIYLTAVGIIPLVALAFWWRWADKYVKDTNNSADKRDVCSAFNVAFSIVMPMASSVTIVVNTLTIVKVLVAPKLFLLEYASKLIN